MNHIMLEPIRIGCLVAVFLLASPGTALQRQARGAEPTVEELKKEIAGLRELLNYQGTWKRTEDGSQVIIEGDRWKWFVPDGKLNNTGLLKVLEVGKDATKVDWIHQTGAAEGTTKQIPMHVKDRDTLLIEDGEGKMTEWKRVTK